MRLLLPLSLLAGSAVEVVVVGIGVLILILVKEVAPVLLLEVAEVRQVLRRLLVQ